MTDLIKIILYVLLIVLVIIIAYSVYSYYNESKYGSAYQNALAVQDPLDKCKTPAGYTDEKWKMYTECLQ